MSVPDSPDPVVARLNAALEGRYAIERELGAGGMATVYLADDLKHGRKVAIKVLRPELAAVVGGERFLVEIRTTAALQHPNILPLFDSGEADSFLFYVMPYVEGESLREKLEREKQLRVEDAVTLTRKVADALDYAHGKGVVHRDIKPANILLSERGEPLVADFGIALAVSQAGGGRITETGLSLGTPHYMSPEQATGDRDVDPRSDLYALGCVLYELLAGQPPFAAPTAQAVLARILTEQPRRVTELRRTVPPHIASVLERALEKLPADRFESAKEFLAALGDPNFTYEAELVTSAMLPATRVASRPASNRPSLGVVAGIAVATLLAGTAIGLALGGGGGGPGSERVPFRTAILTDGFDAIAGTAQWEMTISPDGSRLAWPGEEGIWVREAADEQFRLLPSTAGATYLTFSPDGEWIAYSQSSGTFIRRASITGFEPRTIWESGGISIEDLDWTDDGRIVFSGDAGDRTYLLRIPDTGGAVDTLASEPLAEGSIIDPHALPGARGVLVSRMVGSGSRIDLWRGDTGELEPLVEGRNDPAYLAPGFVLYADAAGGLLAHRFDLDRLELVGDERPALQGMYRGLYRSRYSISDDGTLALGVGGSGGGLGGTEAVLFERWFDGDEVRDFNLSARDIESPRWDPQGRRVAYQGAPPSDNSTTHVWVYDTQLQNAPVQVTTSGAANFDPVWSPDGRRIAFAAIGRGGGDPTSVEPYVVDLDVDALPRALRPPLGGSDAAISRENAYPTSWPNDSTLVMEIGANSRIEVWTLRGDSLVATRPYYAPTADVDDGRVSPDGSLIAFASDETGRDQVYIGAFPELRSKVLVSDDGGYRPTWGPDGRTLYYRAERGGGWTAADLELDPVPRVLTRRPMPDVGSVTLGSYPDVNPDGTRWVDFRMPNLDLENDAATTERHVLIHDWIVELERLFGEGGR